MWCVSNRYESFHRPCFFPDVILDARGEQKIRYRYERMMTPYEKLKSLRNDTRFLKPSVTFERLDALAVQMSDNEAAAQLHNAQLQLFQRIHEQSSHSSAFRRPYVSPGGQYSLTHRRPGFITFFQTHLGNRDNQ